MRLEPLSMTVRLSCTACGAVTWCEVPVAVTSPASSRGGRVEVEVGDPFGIVADWRDAHHQPHAETP